MDINGIFDNPQLSDSDALPFLENLIGDLKLFDRDIERPYDEDPRPKHLGIQLRRGHVTMEQVRAVTHGKLLDVGQKERAHLIKTGRYADYCLSPEALGYAMIHTSDGMEKWDGIHYDHGDSPDTFRKMGKGLLEIVVRQLLTASSVPRTRAIPFPWPELFS